MIRTIIFDMDGVLCELSDDRRIAFLSQFTAREESELAHAIWGSGFEDDSDAGRYSRDEYLQEFGKRIGKPITASEWVAYRKSGMDPKHDVLECVQLLRYDVQNLEFENPIPMSIKNFVSR